MTHNGRITVEIDLDHEDEIEIFEWIRARFTPVQVFDEEELACWAEANDYIKNPN